MPVLAGSGVSRHDDGYTAGMVAAQDATSALKSNQPSVIIAFVTDHYKPHDVVRGIRSIIGETPLIGCSAQQGICETSLVPNGVVILALHERNLDVMLALATGLGHQVNQAIEQLEAQLDGNRLSFEPDTHMVGLLLHDGITGPLVIDLLLQGLTSFLGPLCPLIGGGSGDSMKFVQATQFVNDQVVSDGVALAILRSATPIGIGVRHGWVPDSRRFVVTHSENSIIYELDGKRAIDAYKEVFPMAELPVQHFGIFGLSHPIGLAQLREEYLIRVPLRRSPEGAIECGGNVPENSLVCIMQSTPDSMLAAAEASARQAMDGLGGRAAAAALVFNCVTRPMILGADAQTELDIIRSIVGAETPIIGMTSFGEIATDGGLIADQNITTVVCVIGKE